MTDLQDNIKSIHRQKTMQTRKRTIYHLMERGGTWHAAWQPAMVER
jgi:hypothetical protein